MPLPASATFALPPFLVMKSVADFTPVATGANRTVAVHHCAAARDVPAAQVPLRVNSAADAPPSPIDPSVSVPPPAFVTVTVWAPLCVPTSWSAYASAPGPTPNAGGVGTTPVPESVATGTAPASVLTVSVALRAPDADGWIP